MAAVCDEKQGHFHGGETFTQCPGESQDCRWGSPYEQVAPTAVNTTHVDEIRLNVWNQFPIISQPIVPSISRLNTKIYLKTDEKNDTIWQRNVKNEAASLGEWLINK